MTASNKQWAYIVFISYRNFISKFRFKLKLSNQISTFYPF